MNSVVHFEVPADDLERAKKFYQETFSWKLQQMGPDMGNYVLATTTESGERGPIKPGAINGGMAKRGAGAITVPSFSIDVPNIEKTVEKIKAGGGETVGEILVVGDMGRMVYFKDTEGNIMSLWESSPTNK